MARANGATPAYGQRLMTNLVDERATSSPDKVFMSIPAGKSVLDGQRDLTYANMARAIDRCAWWMVEELGRKPVDFPAVATYLDPMDVRHPILTLGAVKAGYKMFYSSPRNRPDVQVALLEKLGCTILLAPLQDMSDVAKAVLERRRMDTHVLPDLGYFLAGEGPVERFSYDKTFAEARNDPYVVLHSSGSTGTPKILVLKQGSAAAHDAFQLFPGLGEEGWSVGTWTGKRVATNFPWVHAGGAHILSSGIFNDFVPVIPATWPLTAADADYLHVHGNVQAAWYAPSILADIARNPVFLENIARLANVSYSGGILPADVGKAITKRTRIFGTMASTETGILPSPVPPRELWDHYSFNKRLGHTFRHYADDMYELVLERDSTSDREYERFQGAFFTFLDADTYEMRDLYIQHPTHPGWWRSSGRVDDVVIMSDAKKLNTIPYEAAIESAPEIATALICGSGRPRPAVLVQPTQWPQHTRRGKEEEANKNKEEREPGEQDQELEDARALVDAAWPYFERANEAGPVYGRLIKELVIMTRESKPMARAGGKDTVQRKRSLQLYQDEIDGAYRRAEKLGLLYGEVAEKGGLV